MLRLAAAGFQASSSQVRLTAVRGLATKVPQPSKESMAKREQDLRRYNEEMRALRKDLVEKGYPNKSKTLIREKRIQEGKRKVGKKYTEEEKAAKRAAGEAKRIENEEKMRAAMVEKERKRILKQSIRRVKGDEYRATLLKDAQLKLATDLQQTWNKSVKEDLKAIVPVNAPFLGVLPKFHADIAETYFGDDIERVQYMYGPPVPTSPAERQYGGFDPRVAQYRQRVHEMRSYRRPRPHA